MEAGGAEKIIKTSLSKKKKDVFLVLVLTCLFVCLFFVFNITLHLTNRRQFSMVYTFIDHKMTSKNVQNSSGTTSRRRVVSLPSFGHFMASFYGL